MSIVVRARRMRTEVRWAALVAACGVALSLVSTLAVATAPPSASRSSQVRLAAPVEQPAAVTLRGRATTRVVWLQRHEAGRWQRVRRVPVRQGRFVVRVSRTAVPQRVRVHAAGQPSVVRVVPPREEAAAQVRAPQDACGTQPRKSGGGYWSCTFVDDFSGTELDPTKWVKQTIFSSGDRRGAYACYHEDNVAVGGGALHLTLRREAEPRPCADSSLAPTRYTSGSVMTYRLFSQVHGRFEARIKNTATEAPGLQETFWLWPDDRQPHLLELLWPAAGEIDIVETYSSWSGLAIPFLHYGQGGGPAPGVNTSYCAASRGVWNTYALEWSAQRMEVFVNGRSCLVNTSGDSAFQHAYIMALTQLLGTGGNAPTADTPLPATMSVDYVRVWR